MSGYLHLPGLSTDYPSIPDAAEHAVTEVSMTADLYRDDWATTSTEYIISKSGSYYLYFSSGAIGMQVADSGGNKFYSVAHGLTGSGRHSIEAHLSDNGDGTYAGQILLDGVEIHVSSQSFLGIQTPPVNPMRFGQYFGGGYFTGRLYSVEVAESESSAPFVNIDFTDLTDAEIAAGEFTEDSANAATVTLNGDDWTYVPTVAKIAGKTPELLLRASDYQTGNPKWPDVSGNDHHAQFGSAAGSDTNDPLFKKWDGTDYVYVPGASGNYLSQDDVNLLDADTAHIQQSVGEWSDNINSTPTSSTPSFGSVFGTKALKFGGAASISEKTSAAVLSFTVDATTEYTFSAWVRPVLAEIDQAQVRVSGSVVATTSWQNVSAGEWTELSVTFTTGVSTSLNLVIEFQDSSVTDLPFDGEYGWASAICLRTGSDGTFVPSKRIVGVVDIEMRTSIDNLASNPIPMYWHNATAQLYVQVVANGSMRFRRRGTTSATPAGMVTEGQTHKLRWIGEDNEQRFYVDDVLVDTNTDDQSGADDYSGFIRIHMATSNGSSSMQEGDIEWAVARDGEDGPIVARLDPSAWDEATDPDVIPDSVSGLDWDINRSSSGLVTTVVDRDMFLFTTDDYFVVPDADNLDSGADEEITLLAFAATHVDTGTTTQAIVAKGLVGGASEPFYLLRLDWATEDYDFFGTDGTNQRNPYDETPYVIGKRFVLAGRRDNTGGVSLFLDGEEGSQSPTTTTAGDWSGSSDVYIGARTDGSGTAEKFWEGPIIAVALFRESLTDDEVYAVGQEIVLNKDVAKLHGDGLQSYLKTIYPNVSSGEIVGILNELNGVTTPPRLEYRKARRTYLGLDG